MKMNEETLLAYALNEIENPLERAEVRIALEENADLESAYTEIREFANLLKSEAVSRSAADAQDYAGLYGKLKFEQSKASRPSRTKSFAHILAPWFLGAAMGAAAMLLLALYFAPQYRQPAEIFANAAPESLTLQEEFDRYIEGLKYKYTKNNS